jgi:lipoyl(octanoyl) transferase
LALSTAKGYWSHMTDDGADGSDLPEWRVTPGLSDYMASVREMEAHVAAMLDGTAQERIWLVEHPPVITAGTSSDEADLKEPGRFPLIETGRGGKLTYHGPGQRVVYPMLDLGQRGRDVRAYVASLEQWAIAALADFGVKAFPHEAGTGIWVQQGSGLAKIGAIGVRVRRWVSFHGLSLNVSTDLSHFSAIVPCGIAAHGVTRLQDLAPGISMADLDDALLRHLPAMLGRLKPMHSLVTGSVI